MQYLAQILELISQAEDLTTRIQADFITPATWEKNDKSPVTIGDLAVQTLVAARLEAICPDIPLIAEESADLLLGEDGEKFQNIIVKYVQKYLPEVTCEKVIHWISRGKHEDALCEVPRYWTLDPIDGTKGFLRRQQYATALALIENYQVTAGFLGCPKLAWDGKKFVEEPLSGVEGTVLYALRDKGAFVGNRSQDGTLNGFDLLKVSNNMDIAKAGILRSVESGHTNVGQIDTLVQVLGVKAPPVLMDSQAKYAILAAGQGDLLFRLISHSRPDYKEMIWDQAAGSIIVEEAGGTVTDLDGVPLNFSYGYTLKANRGVCASNGMLHEVALGALRKIGA